MSHEYPWTRYLTPLGATLHVERGAYLPDPADRYGKVLNPQAQPLEVWAAHPCLVILGESGAGKTHTVRRYVEARQITNHRTLRFNLVDFVSDEALIRVWF